MTGCAVIPYIQGVTEPIKIILNSYNVKVPQKPFQTLGFIFAKPKNPVTWLFILFRAMIAITTYIGQAKRTRLKEHQKAVFFC